MRLSFVAICLPIFSLSLAAQVQQQGAAAAGTLQLANMSSASREAFLSSIDAMQLWQLDVANAKLSAALASDTGNGALRVLYARVRNDASVRLIAEYNHGMADAAQQRSAAEQTYLLSMRTNGATAVELLAATAHLLPSDRRIALEYALALTGQARVDSLRALAKRFPDFVGARLFLAYHLTLTNTVEYTQSVLDEATAAATEAIRLAPNLPGPHAALGRVQLWGAGRPTEALPHLQQATRLDAHAETAYTLEAEIYLNDGKANAVNRSRVAWDSARMATPNINNAAVYRMYAAQVLMHDGRTAQMFSELEAEARELERDTAPLRAGVVWRRAAVLAAGTRDVATTNRYLAEASRFVPKPSPTELDLIIDALAVSGQGPAAREALNLLLDQMPAPHTEATQRAIHRYTGLVDLAESKPAEAIAECAQADVHPFCDVVRIEAMRAQGKTKEADDASARFLANPRLASESLAFAVIKYRSMHPAK